MGPAGAPSRVRSLGSDALTECGPHASWSRLPWKPRRAESWAFQQQARPRPEVLPFRRGRREAPRRVPCQLLISHTGAQLSTRTRASSHPPSRAAIPGGRGMSSAEELPESSEEGRKHVRVLQGILSPGRPPFLVFSPPLLPSAQTHLADGGLTCVPGTRCTPQPAHTVLRTYGQTWPVCTHVLMRPHTLHTRMQVQHARAHSHTRQSHRPPACPVNTPHTHAHRRGGLKSERKTP